MRTVIVGYVPTPEGRAALDAGIEEARQHGRRLLVLNNTAGDDLVDPNYVRGTALEQLQAELAALDVPAELLQLSRGGEIAEELALAATEHDAALVVIGIRERSAVGKLILGSAASKILLSLRHPILAVKAT